MFGIEFCIDRLVLTNTIFGAFVYVQSRILASSQSRNRTMRFSPFLFSVILVLCLVAATATSGGVVEEVGFSDDGLNRHLASALKECRNSC